MPKLMDREVQARTMTDLAGVYARHGSLHSAIECYERGLAAIRALGDLDAEKHLLDELEAVRNLAALQAAARS